MLKVYHPDCGYEKEFNFLCPRCGLPFCEEDTQQSIGGALVGHICNKSDIDTLKAQVVTLQSQVATLITDLIALHTRVYRCKNYKV